MKSIKILILCLPILLLGACSSTETKSEPIESANGGSGTTGVINDVTPPTPEVRDPQPVTPPRITQMQVIGVIRELRANGCIVKALHDVDHIHYSELKISCNGIQRPSTAEIE